MSNTQASSSSESMHNALSKERLLSRIDAVFIIVLGIVFGLANSVGIDLGNVGYIVTEPAILAARFILAFIVFALVAVGCYLLCNKISIVPDTWRGKLLPAPSFKKRSILVYALILFAVWLPIIVAMYPGASGWDTFFQIYQCYRHEQGILLNPWWETQSYVHHMFTDHHPLFDTLFYGLFARGSEFLFGTWNYGFFALSLLHAGGMAVSLTASIAWTERIGTPRLLRLLALAFCGLMPFFAFYASAILKDTTNCVVFLPYLLCIAECVRTRGTFLSTGKGKGVTIAFAILVCLTKKTGLYLVLATTLLVALWLRKAVASVLTPLLASAAVMMVLLPYVVFPLVDAVPGGEQEKYGFAFQQVVRCLVTDAEKATPAEKQTIDAVIPYEQAIEKYNPFKTDSVKDLYRWSTCTKEDLRSFLLLWAEWGFRHPITYIQSLMAACNHFFDMEGSLTIYESSPDKETVGDFSRLSVPRELARYRGAVTTWYRWLTEESPFPIRLLFRTGLYSFLIPALVACTLVRRRPEMLVALTPVWVCMLFLVISPVFMPRYALSVIFACPMLMCTAACSTTATRRD